VPGAEEGPDRPTAAEVGHSSPPTGFFVGVPASPGVGVGRVVHASEPAGAQGGRVGGTSSRAADGVALVPPPAPGVVVATDLDPAHVMTLDPEAVEGMVTVAGAPLSRAAILARSLGIPW
jgi:hypothetical protein